ncbi:MAG TPA: winged helix DNA-binding domain-containing protein [Candidatus Limnocylindrales bacterium]|nr:winged helix DNA-binding domain-containing protein [Candidatus Limnocylindrales bacterium]
MTVPRRGTTAPALALDPAKVDRWRIERQLLGRTQGTGPVEVARTLVGVQAQVTSSAALAIALRSKPPRGRQPAVEATARALRERTLVRSWAMRGTLHLFAADDVPTVAAALAGKDMWRRPAWLRWFGLTEREMEALIDTIGEVLDDGAPRSRAELAEEIGRRLGPRQGEILRGSWGSALKIASDSHYLVQSAEEGAGTRFVRASHWLGSWREEDRDEALAKLVERYLAAYGPATFRELLRWWGMGVFAVMKPIIAGLGDRLTEVDVAGVRAYVRTADLDSIEATRRKQGSVKLVGGFDPLIVGAGLRERLLPAAHLKRISRTAGWISPVVLVDGVAAGVWDSRRTANGLAMTIEMFERSTPAARAAIGAAAERIAAVQGVDPTIAFGKVFAEKRSGQPFNDR